jgi:hypothetical protein
MVKTLAAQVPVTPVGNPDTVAPVAPVVEYVIFLLNVLVKGFKVISYSTIFLPTLSNNHILVSVMAISLALVIVGAVLNRFVTVFAVWLYSSTLPSKLTKATLHSSNIMDGVVGVGVFVGV